MSVSKVPTTKAAAVEPEPVHVPEVAVSKQVLRQQQYRLPVALIEQLDVEARRRNVSKNFIVEAMIAAALPAYEAQVLDV
jgi:hypothetical protein